jgi:hypothetical protein
MGIIQNSPQNKGLVKKKTRQWHCTLGHRVVSMRGSILPVFVSPRQCAVICLSGSDLRNPHHEYKFHFQFSTYRSVRWTSAVLLTSPSQKESQL